MRLFACNNQKEFDKKKRILLVLALLMAIGLTACNTMEGLGSDIERGGEKLQDPAKNNRKKM